MSGKSNHDLLRVWNTEGELGPKLSIEFVGFLIRNTTQSRRFMITFSSRQQYTITTKENNNIPALCLFSCSCSFLCSSPVASSPAHYRLKSSKTLYFISNCWQRLQIHNFCVKTKLAGVFSAVDEIV